MVEILVFWISADFVNCCVSEWNEVDLEKLTKFKKIIA